MFEKEKTVDLKQFGYDKPAIVKRLSAGEKKALDNEITRSNSIEMRGKDVVGKLMPGDSTLIYAWYYYKEGPFPKDKKILEEQDWELIALLEEAGDELNNPLVMKPDSDSLLKPGSS
jgi:hypothetical protein